MPASMICDKCGLVKNEGAGSAQVYDLEGLRCTCQQELFVGRSDLSSPLEPEALPLSPYAPHNSLLARWLERHSDWLVNIALALGLLLIGVEIGTCAYRH